MFSTMKTRYFLLVCFFLSIQLLSGHVIKTRTTPTDDNSDIQNLMAKAYSVDELMKLFGEYGVQVEQERKDEVDSGDSHIGLGRVFHEYVDEPIEVEKSERCFPTLAPVQIPQPTDPSIVYFPKCAILDQCAGCCRPGKACKPIKTHNVSVGVHVVHKLSAVRAKRYLHKVIMEKHVSCGCSCNRVEASDCTELQFFSEDECKCFCKDPTRKSKCPTGTKYNRSTCNCECDMSTCIPPFYLNQQTCLCEPYYDLFPESTEDEGLQIDRELPKSLQQPEPEKPKSAKMWQLEVPDIDEIP